MYNISSLEEARKILAKEPLADADIKELLLYFTQRDEEIRNTVQKLGLAISVFTQAFPPLLLGLTKITPPDEEIIRQVQEALRVANEFLTILEHHPVVQ